MKPLFSSLLLVLTMALQVHAADTLLHYRVNAGGTAIENVNGGTTGNPVTVGSISFSNDIPEPSVSSGLGPRSTLFNGTSGLKAGETQQLLNADILSNGGFTYETWFKYTGGGTVNTIIDYAGTEKLRRVDSDTDVSMLTHASSTSAVAHSIAPAGNDWHYVAVVFDKVTDSGSGSITGDYTFYFDSTVPSGTASGVIIGDFGDSLTRTIGIGMHPEGFAGDFFNGLIYEPRVTLGALAPADLLFKIRVTTLIDEDDGTLGDGSGVSLREAINHSPEGSFIVFDPGLDGGTITLTTGTELTIDNALTIDASSLPNGITIDANGEVTDHRVLQINSGHAVALDGLTLTGGKVADSGGAIHSDHANLILENCTISNSSAFSGGGIYSNGNASGSASLSLSACTISGNVAQQGGGIYSSGTSGGSATLSLDACTVSGNTASIGNGGGLYSNGFAGSATLDLHASTVVGNEATIRGGGIYSANNSSGSATLSLIDSILAANAAPTGADLGGGLTTTTLTGVNLMSDLSGNTAGLTEGSDLIVADPQLAALGDYGGSTQTMPPFPGSLVINAATSSTRTHDQRGFPIVGIPDIGAAESRGLDSIITWAPTAVLVDADLSGALNASASQSGTITYDREGTEVLPLGSYQTTAWFVPSDPLAHNPAVKTVGLSILNDLNGDGTLGVTDLAAIVSAVHFDPSNLVYDIDDNGVVDEDDVSAFETQLGAFADVVVTNLDDIGSGSLREALGAATASPGTRITFAGTLNGQTIALSNGQLEILAGQEIFIDASDLSEGITLGANNSRVLTLAAGSRSALHSLTLTGGNTTGVGGAINNDHANLSLTACTLSGNSAGAGGGLLNAGSSPTIAGCLFQNNSSTSFGGAIFNSNSSPILTNCSLQGNRSGNFGGAIFNGNSSPILTNCSLQGNHAADNGGAIYNLQSSPTLTNCIIWKNGADGDSSKATSSISDQDSTPIYTHCLIQHWTASDLNDGNSLDGTDSANDPLFSSSSLRLFPGSPAIDAGLDSANLTITDLAGRARIIGTQIDLGAYETDPQDYRRVRPGASGAADGSSWTDAFPDLQAALAAAVPGQTILLTEGTYYPDEGTGQTDGDRQATFALKSGVTLVGGFRPSGSGRPDNLVHRTVLSGDIDQNDEDGVTLTNNEDNAYHVVTADGVDASASLQGLIISSGFADGSSSGEDSGGGLYCVDGASPQAINCIFQGNVAEHGGGIYSNASAPTLINCAVQGNFASEGGGIANDAASPLLINCTFQGNAASQSGGAIRNRNGSAPSLANCLIWNNAAMSRTTTPEASIADDTNSTYAVASSFIHNISFYNSDHRPPPFLAEIDPHVAPTLDGDLRVIADIALSRYANPGLNPISMDLAGSVRFAGASMELGAYERESPRFLYVNHSASGSGDGSSFEDAFPHLQDALAAATPGDAVLVAPGTYFPDQGVGQTEDDRGSSFTLKPGVALLGGSSFSLFDLAEATILSGDLDQNDGPGSMDSAGNAFHVVTAEGGEGARIDGVIISAGQANGATLAGGGGGLYCMPGASPAIADCTFRDNAAERGGAAFASQASPTFLECVFRDNVATDAGGAVFVIDSGSSLFKRCTFQGNTAVSGGALSNHDATSTITGCLFQGNESTSTGGAIRNVASSIQLINSAFQGNAASHGGAIGNEDTTLTLIHCSFQGNAASSDGGAFYNDGALSPTLTNCILWNNAANGSTTTVTASIASSAAAPIYSHCLVENLDLSGASNNLDGTSSANHPRFIAEVDPLSAPHLAGGDLRLLPESAALDVGEASANPELIDLQGQLRQAGTGTDLGAFEQQGFIYVHLLAFGDDSGDSWANALDKLQDALAVATAGQTIVVSQGTYYADPTFTLKSGVAVVGGFPHSGNGLRDPASHQTILSGDLGMNDHLAGANNKDDNASRVLNVEGVDRFGLLDGVTITAGFGEFGEGVGLYCQESSPTLNHCAFVGITSNNGSAIFMQLTQLTLSNCSFEGNTASNTIVVNYSEGLLHQCSFLDNQASAGVFLVDNESTASLTDCVFRENDGLAIRISSDGSAKLTRCTIQGNQGVGVRNRGFTTLANCTIQGNGSDAVHNVSGSTTILANCTIQGNTGHAIYNDDASCRVINSLLWNGGSSVLNENDGVLTYAHSLVENLDLSSIGTANLDGTNPANLPLFVSHLNGDLRLLPDSPAINVGLNVMYPGRRDLAGNLRLQDGQMDLGAYDYMQDAYLYVDESVSAGNSNGSSWATAYPKLQDALTQATPGKIILTAKGTYYPDESANTDSNNRDATFALRSGVALLGGYPSGGSGGRQPALHETTLSGDLQQDDGPGFSGNEDNAKNVLTAVGVDSLALLDGFTVTAGNAPIGIVGGGGLRAENASPTLSNCKFQGNASQFLGGAVYLISSSPTFTNCAFLDNLAAEGGGGIFNTDSFPTLTNCTFLGNAAPFGGAMASQFTSRPVLFNCIFWNNTESGSTSQPGSSVLDASNDGTSPTSFTHCLVQNWSASDLDNSTSGSTGNLAPSNPRFFSETQGDLRLLPGSPAIDTGLTSVNLTSVDLAHNLRQAGTGIDLGTHESSGFLDLSPIWALDRDGDGSSYGVEFALGTDPFVPDAEDAANPSLSINASGQTVIQFGHETTAESYTHWVLKRSTDLVNYDVELYRYDGIEDEFSNEAEGPGLENGVFEVIDPSADGEVRYFYRFEAELTLGEDT